MWALSFDQAAILDRLLIGIFRALFFFFFAILIVFYSEER